MIIKKLLPYQAAFIQAPYLYPEVRFTFLVGGYGCGKTSSLTDAILKAVMELAGKKDREGKNPKIGVCGINLAFLKKTLSGSLLQVFNNTKTPYKYRQDENIIYISGVELHLTPIEDPAKIFGFDWSCIGHYCPISTKRGNVRIKDLKIGDEVFTRSGYKKVKGVLYRGIKDTVKLKDTEGNSVWLTKDHRVYTTQKNFIEARHLTDCSRLVTINKKENKHWLAKKEEQLCLKKLLETVSLIIDTQNQVSLKEGCTLQLLVKTLKKDLQNYIEIYGKKQTEKYQKDLLFIIKTVIHLITIYQTWDLYPEANIYLYTILCGVMKELKSNENQCLKLKKLEQSIRELQKEEKKLAKQKNDLGKKESKTQMDGMNQLAQYVEGALNHCLKQLDSALKNVLMHTEEKVEELRLKRNGNSYFKSRGTRIKRQKVYDIEVEDDNEFFAGGILVHNCAFVDELDELPTYKAIEAVRAINERCRQSIEEFRPPFIAFGSTSQGLKGIYQVVQSFIKDDISYIIIRGRTKDNIYLPKESVEFLYKTYNDKERRCLLDGEFISIDSGLVYPDYNPAVNRLDYDVFPNEKDIVHIGQDFNCIDGDSSILTDKGLVPIRNIVLGTRVLTRKGYKKVLTKKNNGSRIVVRCGKVWTTLDHVFITPQGDEERWKLSNYYYLKKQHRSKFHDVKMLKVKEQQLLSYIKDIYGDHIKERVILSSRAKAETSGCTERYMKTLLVKYLVEWLFTIKTDFLITVLKTYRFLRGKNTLKNITQEKELKNTGRKESLKKKGLFVEYAVKHLQGILKQLKYAEESVSMLGKENGDENFTEQFLNLKAESVFGKLESKTVQYLVNPLRKLADAVALCLKEKVNLFTALRVLKVVKTFQNGRVLYGVEREVFDIEVEDAHEFFAEGVLVHNCGFNKAVACIVREGVIYVVKEYSFPDVRHAPEVFRNDFPKSRIKWIPDATERDVYFSFRKELKAYDIQIVSRNKNPLVRDRNFTVNKLFYTQRLFICDFCKGLDNALIIHQYDPKTGTPQKGTSEKAPDHFTDGLGYVVYYLVMNIRELKPVYDVTLARSIRKRLEKEETTMDDEIFNVIE